MAKSVSLDEALRNDEDQQQPTVADVVPDARGKKGAKAVDDIVKPVKLTIELEPELHRRLKRFALLDAEDASLASLVRAAVVVMGENERFAKAVIREAANQRRRRG
ncbi:MAG TPA: DUF2274 domain-containing protein [Amycolatopsis sp.]|nr:DUF2274 domain-containing protein [Amycolatopsis sp.]